MREQLNLGVRQPHLLRTTFAMPATTSPRLEVWSGGQTGVDRAALDAALELGLPIAGWVPQGRLAEDGVVPQRYVRLRETDSPEYAVRTRLNVRDTDATLVLRIGPAGGGTLDTVVAARTLGRPLLELDLGAAAPPETVARLTRWLGELFETHLAVRLNVAGPRASQAPSVYALAYEILHLAMARYAAV
jgi:predicted Rossmann-fold nucleotide-binding protein